jgi:hypothetical protein
MNKIENYFGWNNNFELGKNEFGLKLKVDGV